MIYERHGQLFKPSGQYLKLHQKKDKRIF